MKLKNILDDIPSPKVEKATTDNQRMLATSGKHIKDVVIGGVKGKNIPAKYDPELRIFYPLFKA